MAQISLAEVSELQGKGVDVLTSQIAQGLRAKSASNDPADAEAKVKAETEAKATEEAKKPKPKPVDDGMQKRMNELTRLRHSAERETAAEREKRERLEAENAELREQVAKAKPVPAKPKREDFEDIEAFADALVDFKLAEKSAKEADERKGKDAKEAESRTKREGEEAARKQQEKDREDAELIVARFGGSLKKAQEAHEDFDEVVAKGGMVKPSLHAAIVHSEMGGELMYHFGEHPDLVDKLNGLDQASMLKELGKIELSLASKGDGDGAVDQPRGADGKFLPAGSKEISSAAKPIEPVKGGESGAGPKDPERMTVAEHREAAARAAGKLR